MATYVNDLRLKEIGTGESSGTWGTETNVNLELIGEALGFGTEAITTNADTHTTTVADGSTDPGRAMYIKYTGTLDSACTITIGPNTINRLHYIENATSGSQNIIISQGSGANITIPAGDTKAVYLDGAGSGAAVVDVFASFSTVDLKVQDDLTVTDDATIGGTLGVTGILTCTDDIIIGDGKTIGSASDVDAMTIAANGQVTFTQTLIGTALDISGDIDVDGTANLDVVDIDGAVDMASTLAVADTVTITLDDNADNLSLVTTDADANSGPNLNLYRNSSSPANNDFLGNIKFVGRNNNTQDVQYAEQEVYITDVSDGAEDGLVNWNVMTAGSNLSYFQLRAENAEVVINEDSNDIDFRVESDANTHMFHVDAGNNKVGINTSAGDGLLHVQSATAGTVAADAEADELVLESSGNTGLSLLMPGSGLSSILFGNPGTNGQKDGAIRYYGETHSTTANRRNMVFSTGNAETMRLASDQDVLIGTDSAASEAKLHVEVATSNPNAGSPTDSSALMINGGTTTVGNGPVLALRNISGSKETIARLTAETVSGNNGDLTISVYAGGSTVDEKIRVQSGGGISFNGDTAAANALDDYEEGTWTPTITGATLGTATGHYTKIGRHVFYTFTISSVSGTPSVSTIGGLPFTVTSTATRYPMSFSNANNFNLATQSGLQNIAGFASPSSATIQVTAYDLGVAFNISNLVFGSSAFIEGGGHYHT
jgi:hypothetical protein